MSPDTGDNESLGGGAAVGRVLVPEADQQVAAEPDALPAQVQEQQIVGEDEDQHGGHEEIHAGEEPAVALARRGPWCAMNAAE